MAALCKLEDAGIQVVTSLTTAHKQLARAAKVTLDEEEHTSPKENVEMIIRQWTHGKGHAFPPTWRSLYQVLGDLGLKELGQQIEEFFTSGFGK